MIPSVSTSSPVPVSTRSAVSSSSKMRYLFTLDSSLVNLLIVLAETKAIKKQSKRNKD